MVSSDFKRMQRNMKLKPEQDEKTKKDQNDIFCACVLRLSDSLAITMPLPPLAVIMKPALMTEMMARPSAFAIT